jgi:alpha-1,6-mannosyltransferase
MSSALVGDPISFRLVDQRWRLPLVVGAGLGVAWLFWSVFTSPFALDELCARTRPTWVFPLFERPRYTAMAGDAFLLVLAVSGGLYLLAVRLTTRLRGPRAAILLLGVVPLALVAVLYPAYPLLSSDIFKYVFDGRILAVYGQNPFLHVPAEYPADRFYDLVYWKAVVNAHGPLWRVAEAAAAQVGGESCQNAVLAMKVWPTLAYLATTSTLYAILRAWQPERALWGAMLFAWNPLVVLESVQNGHNDVVAALPAVVACWLAFRGRFGWAFPVLAIAFLVKPLAAVLGPLILVAALRRRPPAYCDAAFGMGCGAALVVVAYLPFWDGPATFQGLSRENLFSTSPAKALLDLLRAGGLPLDRALPIASGAAHGLFAVLLISVLFAAWRGRLAVMPAAFGVVFLYLLVGAQWFNPWYLLWLMPFAALVPRPPRVLGVTFSLLAPTIYAAHDSWPIVAVVFIPLTALAVYWRAWLGWGRARAVAESGASDGESRPLLDAPLGTASPKSAGTGVSRVVG